VNERTKALAKRVLPTPVQRLIRRYRRGDGVYAVDLAAIWEYKRPFFWSAFKALDFNGIDRDYVAAIGVRIRNRTGMLPKSASGLCVRRTHVCDQR
jgi:hypothetical protein